MKVVLGTALAALIAVPSFAQSKVAQRLDAATVDVRELTHAGDQDIPTDLLNRATCIVVIPGLKKGGFIIGAEYGKGFFSCRRPGGVGWSAPGSVRIAGGKFGLLIGGAETDLVMLVMNRRGMDSLLTEMPRLSPTLRCVPKS